MGQAPEDIRRGIEQTREQMSETVEAIGYKADVPSRTKEKISDKLNSAKSAITGAASGVADTASGAASSVGDSASSVAGAAPSPSQVVQRASNMPVGLLLGGLAVGFAIGQAIPTTQVENEKLGPVSDQLKETAKGAASEAVAHGKQVASEVAEAASEAATSVAQSAKDSSTEHAQELASSVTP